MDYLAFLEKNERTKLGILGVLAENARQDVEVKQIIDQVSITRYKFNQLIDELIQDLGSIQQKDCQLTVKDNLVVCDGIDYSICQQLQLIYLKQSPRFQVFEFEYLNQQTQSRQKFLLDHFMSQSKYYALRTQVENVLDNKAVTQARPIGGSLHPELVERAKISNIYYHFFNGIEDPFPELESQTSRFCNFLSMTFGISLTPSERLKLKMFVQIQIKRLVGRHFLNIRHMATLERDTRLPFLKNYYLENVPHSGESDIDSEICYLFLFLRSQRIMASVPVKFCQQLQQQYNSGSKHFERVLAETPVINQAKFTGEDQQKTAQHIAQLTVWLMMFNYFDFTEVIASDQSHMAMDFPALSILGKQLVEEAIRVFDLQLCDECRAKLLKSYVKILIADVPSSLARDNVTICVDFVQSIVPMDYFAKLLVANLGAGIVLTNQLSSDVDVFLSDIYVASIHDIPQVTLLDPLKTSSWEKLRQTVADVKQTKLEGFLAAS